MQAAFEVQEKNLPMLVAAEISLKALGWFWALSGAFFVVAGLIYTFFHNRATRSKIENFVKQSEGANCVRIQNVQIRYSDPSGLKAWVSPVSRCNVFLFDGWFAIQRLQKSLFRLKFAPQIISSDVQAKRIVFPRLDILIPHALVVKNSGRREIDIKLKDTGSGKEVTGITLINLSPEQFSQLEALKAYFPAAIN